MTAKGVYVARLDATGVTAAITLVQINAAAGTPCEILRAWVGQTVSETSEQTEVQMRRASTGGTGTAFTPIALNGAGAADASATNNHSAEGTAANVLLREAFNFLNGWLYLPVPEERIIIPGGGRLALRLPTAPSGSMTIDAGIVWQEIG